MTVTNARNLHIPLPENLYKLLKTEAKQAKKPATALARRAIEAWLRRRQKVRIHEAITAYASKFAGTESDLDAELESASIEHLTDTKDS